MKQMSGYSDIVPGRTARGGEAIAMRIWHIVESPKGSIAQDPSLGWGLPSRLGKKTNDTSLKTEATIGRAEIIKDPEVLDATVVITRLDGGRYSVAISAFPTTGAAIEINNVLQGTA
jgi:hypothetical protein